MWPMRQKVTCAVKDALWRNTTALAQWVEEAGREGMEAAMKWMKREARNEKCVLDGEAEELMVEALRTLHNESSKHAEMRKASVKRPGSLLVDVDKVGDRMRMEGQDGVVVA